MRADRQSGFTLLEVLVAIVVMGFLFVALVQGTQFGMRAWNMQTRSIEERGDLDAVDRFIRRLVEQTDVPTANGGPTLLGGPTRLVFTSRLPTEVLPAGRADIAFAVDGSHQLEVRWSPHVHAIRLAAAPAPQASVLLNGVQKLEISYWRQDSVGGWLKSWSAHELPALIRFRIEFGEKDTRHWPDIIVALVNGH